MSYYGDANTEGISMGGCKFNEVHGKFDAILLENRKLDRHLESKVVNH